MPTSIFLLTVCNLWAEQKLKHIRCGMTSHCQQISDVSVFRWQVQCKEPCRRRLRSSAGVTWMCPFGHKSDHRMTCFSVHELPKHRSIPMRRRSSRKIKFLFMDPKGYCVLEGAKIAATSWHHFKRDRKQQKCTAAGPRSRFVPRSLSSSALGAIRLQVAWQKKMGHLQCHSKGTDYII